MALHWPKAVREDLWKKPLDRAVIQQGWRRYTRPIECHLLRMPLPCAYATRVARQLEALLVALLDYSQQILSIAADAVPNHGRKHRIDIGPALRVERQASRVWFVPEPQ